MTEEAKKKRHELAHSRALNIELKAKRLLIQPKVYENANRSFQKGFDAGYQVAMDEANERIAKLREALVEINTQNEQRCWFNVEQIVRAALKEDDSNE